jgi:hypothetical protein
MKYDSPASSSMYTYFEASETNEFWIQASIRSEEQGKNLVA